MTASGSVGDYQDTLALRNSVAEVAGVKPSAVTISVVAASVIITATIAVPASTTVSAVETALSTRLGTAAAASAQLGITVETAPTVTIASSNQPVTRPGVEKETEDSGGGAGMAGPAAGGAVAVLLLIVGGVAVFWLRKRRAARRPAAGLVVSGKPTHPGEVTVQIDGPSSLKLSSASALSSAADAKIDARIAKGEAKRQSYAQLLAGWELNRDDITIGPKVGEGGQASVYKGKFGGMPVAIKMARVKFTSNERAKAAELNSIQQTVRREVRALSRVRHPNVVRLQGACMQTESPLVVMSWAANGSLQDALDYGNLASMSSLEIVALLCGIARGMEAVHAHKVIHLDLKPDNVLLGPGNVPWVTDFGLSTSSNQGSASESTVGGRGTLYYKPPEMLALPPVVSAACDIYSYGVLAWTVVTGEKPWLGVEHVDVTLPRMLEKGRRPELADGTDWRERTAPALAKSVEAAWAQDHKARPSFGGKNGLVVQLDELCQRMTRVSYDDDDAIDAIAERVFAAECEADAAKDLMHQYDEAIAAIEADTAESDQKPTVEQAHELKAERAALTVTADCATRAADSAKKQLVKVSGDDLVLQQVMNMMVEMNATLQKQILELSQDVKASSTTLTSIAMGELDCPRLVSIIPDQRKGLRDRAAGKFKDRYRIVFLDAVTGHCVPCGPDGFGYVKDCPLNLKRLPIFLECCLCPAQLATLPKAWLIEHGPRIRDGLLVLRLMVSTGRLAGLPIDAGCLPREVVSKREAEAVAKMNVLLGGDQEAPGSTRRNKEVKTATGKAYRALKALVSEQCNDRDLQHCGLAKVKARDGTVEWVSDESRARFEQEGAACLVWNTLLGGDRGVRH